MLIQRLNCIDIGSTSEKIYLMVVKQGVICELYAGVLQSERELALQCRVHCCEIKAWKSSLICLLWLPMRSLLQLQNKRSIYIFPSKMVRVNHFSSFYTPTWPTTY